MNDINKNNDFSNVVFVDFANKMKFANYETWKDWISFMRLLGDVLTSPEKRVKTHSEKEGHQWK